MQFIVLGLACDRCTDSATTALLDINKVSAVKVDTASGEAHLELAGDVSRERVREVLAGLGFETRFPGDPVFAPLSADEKATLDLRVIADGKAFDVQSLVVPGKVAVFDYYADWCGPCKLLSPRLERLAATYGDVALRKVDIKDWESPAARQATRDFQLPGLPYVRVYGPTGRFLGAVHGNRADEVEQLIKKGLGR